MFINILKREPFGSLQNEDKRHFWRLSFCIFETIYFIIRYFHPKI